MGGDGTMDLADHADVLRKALSESQANSDKLVNILGSFDERLSALEADMRPTQVTVRVEALVYCMRILV